MARNNGGGRSAAPGSNAQLIIGILIGMVLGLAVAGGVAWQIMKTPSPFLGKEQHPAAEPVAASAPPKTAAAEKHTAQAPASAVGEAKPRFEFYKILTDKDGAAAGSKPGSGKTVSASKESAPSAQGSTYFLQAGSFSTAEDADKLKARLALAGLEASVQPANVPEKGVRYRVRLGPYRSADEMRKVNESLKQNGIADAAQVRAQ